MDDKAVCQARALLIIEKLEESLADVQRLLTDGDEQKNDLKACSNSIWNAQLMLKRYLEKLSK